MSEHTPGPWYANGDCIEAAGEEGPRDRTLAVVHGTERDANARLIAAAPELLACLHSLRVVFASLEGWRDMDATLVDQFISSDGLHRVDAAIAKATGEESE